MLERKDIYDIYEVKYYSEPMQLREIHKEVAQINAVKGLKVGQIGFIATAGYEDTPDGYDFIDINSLYTI